MAVKRQNPFLEIVVFTVEEDSVVEEAGVVAAPFCHGRRNQSALINRQLKEYSDKTRRNFMCTTVRDGR